MTRFDLQPLGLPACLALLVLSGCATKDLTLSKALPWPSSAKKYETPEKVIAIWTDAVYQLPGKAPTRGFGGRVYFYNAKDEVIPVDGQLVVYAFDDSDPNASRDQPSRKYAFTADQLTRYYSDSDLGASYNIWIPWDAVGGDEKQVALFPVFVDDSGKTVRGTFANNRLPGKRIFSEEERRGFYISRKRRQGSQVISQAGIRRETGGLRSGSPCRGGDRRKHEAGPRNAHDSRSTQPVGTHGEQRTDRSPAAGHQRGCHSGERDRQRVVDLARTNCACWRRCPSGE